MGGRGASSGGGNLRSGSATEGLRLREKDYTDELRSLIRQGLEGLVGTSTGLSLLTATSSPMLSLMPTDFPVTGSAQSSPEIAESEAPELVTSTKRNSLSSRPQPLVWLRTTRSNPCPCCGKHGWCEISEDGTKAHCMHREYGGTPIEYRGGGRIIELKEKEWVAVSQLAKRVMPVEKLPVEKLNEVNREFMRLCPLKPEHKSYLEAEGVPTNDIGSLVLSQATRIARELVRQFGEETVSRHPLLKQFTSRDGNRQFWGIAAGTNGILFPARNIDGQISGIQIRADNPTDKSQRYHWLSSEGKGGTPLSVFRGKAGAGGNEHAHTLVITEGYKKAAAINEAWGAPAISIAGVGAYSREELVRTVEALGIKRVVLAFDQDKHINSMVAEAEERMLRNLHQSNSELELNRLEWDISLGKGLDDAIKAGAELKLEKANLADKPVPAPASQEASGQVTTKLTETPQAVQGETLRKAQNEAERAKKVRQK
jgi:Domain of unknown function (DUF3854)